MTALAGPGQIRRGTAATWASDNPTLLAGELGVTLETGGYNKGVKIGNGASAWNALGFAPDIIGALVNGGYMYGNAQNGGLAFGRADRGKIIADDNGSVAGGNAYGDTGSSSHAQIVAAGPGSFAHGASSMYGFTSVGYTMLRASGGGAHAFGNVYAPSDSKALMSASGQGAMTMGYVWGTSSTVTSIQAQGRGSFAGGYAKGSANSAIASGKGAFQWGPGTNAVDQSLAVGGGLRLNANGAPASPRNGDIWVASNYVYIRTNGISKKIS